MKNQVKLDEGIDLESFDKEAEIAKFKNVKLAGWSIMVRLYTQPKKIGNLYMPDSVHQEQQYKNFVGLVVSMSDAAYKDDARYKDTGPYCKIGDWVFFPRHSGYKMNYHGMPVFVLNEDVISGVLKDPINDIPYISK